MSEEGVVGQVTERSGMPGRDKRVKTGFLALVQAIRRASPALGDALMWWSQVDVDLNPDRVLPNWATVRGGGQSCNALEHSFLVHHPGPTPSSLWMVARIRDCVSTMPRPGPRMCSKHSRSHCPPHALVSVARLRPGQSGAEHCSWLHGKLLLKCSVLP